jgi:hypothetical protein
VNIVEAAKWLRRWLTSRALLNFLLVVFTGGVWFATCQYADTTKKSQRPWVGTFQVGTQAGDDIKGGLTLAPDVSLDIAVAYKNFGLSPALRTSATFHTLLGAPTPADTSDWTADTAPKVSGCYAEVDSLPGDPLFPNPGNLYSFFMRSFATDNRSANPRSTTLRRAKPAST